MVQILLHNARGNQEILSIRTIQKKQIFAQAERLAVTVEAVQARGRVSHNHRIAFHALRHPGPDRRNYSSYFVTETGGCALKKDRVAPAKSFEISATGRGRCYLQEYFSGSRLRNRTLFQTHIQGRVEQGCKHRFASTSFLISVKDKAQHV